MHSIELLIRSAFFFVMNESATPKEKETLLNIFTWMNISSFQNLFNIETRYWKVGYYFRNLLKYLFLNGSEQIQIYDKYSNNIKKNMIRLYSNTTNKLKSYLSNDSAPIVKFPNNLPYSKMLSLRKSNKNHIWIGCPFFLTTGKDIDKNDENKLKLYIAIGTYIGFYDNNFLIKNVILSYSNL